MERKKVAVLLPWLKMGGTNKVALRFMKELVEYCDVTLVLSQNVGELLGEIPEGVALVIDEMMGFKQIFKDDCKHFRLTSIVKDFTYYWRIRNGKDNIDNYRYIVERHQYISEQEFDCAITYHGQSPERLLNLIYRIHAKKKVAWIHGEMSFSKETCQRMKKYYSKMNHFFFVSNHTKEMFDKSIGLKSMDYDVYYNPLNGEEIRRRASELMDVDFSTDDFNIVTVGRISSEKGQDMIPSITRKLLDNGKKVKWYLIGDGPEKDKLKALILEYHVEDFVILLGVKSNPFCYVKNADLYVQPSYTEGYSTTICEAGILGKAIIGTKPSGGIYDQLIHEENGLIVDATIDGLYEGIMDLYDNNEKRHKFETNILKKNFEGKGEIQKFLDYLYE